MVNINGEDLFVFNDQVGNVEALFGDETNTAAQARAEYIYSSYGEIMMKSGDLADKNNITYSTRYKEANTGLVSYTYRHYSPRLKKWLSKDPIAEQGGINLYQMVGNDPVGYWDVLGYAYMGLNVSINKIVNRVTNSGSFFTVKSTLNWFLGDGTDMEVNINDILENKDKDPFLFSNFKSIVDDICSSKVGSYIYEIRSISTREIYYLSLGRIPISLSGNLVYFPADCTWSFSGTISSTLGYDIYDFNHESIGKRPIWAEALTRTASAYEDLSNNSFFLPNTASHITKINGIIHVSEKGNCYE